ncbi:MAG: shikimate dehydrogenase [Thermoproteota archaeon]|nr:shikimate dehydrogenase [Candidatus Brockarchaeota archaeon]MBO3801620.1 shikimate dehydrogenase [Candidatus Brockarchaeota archaeon]
MFEINYSTKLFGVLGNNIQYTLSPIIHNYSFSKVGANAVYLAFDISKEKFSKVAQTLIDLCAGLNVTIPYKEKIMGFLDDVNEKARTIGAINTISNKKGYNTDYIAIQSLVLEKLKSINGFKCIVFGAGGAAKAVAFALGDLGCSIFVYNRTPERGKLLVDMLNRNGINAELAKEYKSADIVVNAVPVQDFINPKYVSGILAIDLLYSPVNTEFLKLAKLREMKTISGIEVLVRQALESEKLWFGKSLSDEEVIAYLDARKFIW